MCDGFGRWWRRHLPPPSLPVLFSALLYSPPTIMVIAGSAALPPWHVSLRHFLPLLVCVLWFLLVKLIDEPITILKNKIDCTRNYLELLQFT